MSNGVKRWKVLDWPDRPATARTISLACPKCGWDGELEVGEMPGALIVATIGLAIVFEPPGYAPPSNSMPEAIQCRGCRRVWASEKESV
jgi:hypothetical protein